MLLEVACKDEQFRHTPDELRQRFRDHPWCEPLVAAIEGRFAGECAADDLRGALGLL
jgi:hypothetical protein